jgi:Cysteine rich repeat.
MFCNMLCLLVSTKYLFMYLGSKVSRDCQMEMMEHRKILMEDYRLSPEIVTDCSEDIKSFCNTLEVGGKTIHCLMEHARPKKRKGRVSPTCQRAVSLFCSVNTCCLALDLKLIS